MFFSRGPRHKLLTIGGIPVYVERSILMLLVLFLLLGAGSGPAGVLRSLILCVVAIASIIWHELGHAFAVKRLGYGDSVIVLHGLGGVTQWRGSPNRRDRILIALAGPGFGLILGGAVWALVLGIGMPEDFLLRTFAWALLFINIGWSIFNLMPIWPLDGGHVLRYALVSPRRSQSRTLQISLVASMITAGILIAFSAMIQAIFMVVLLGFLLYNNYQEYQNLRDQRRPPSSFYGY